MRIQAGALGPPPTSDRGHGKRARIMDRSHVDESSVTPQIVDSIGIGAGHLGTWKIMSLNLLRLPLWAPLAALVLVIADQFFLLRVHGNHRLVCAQSGFHSAADVTELRIAVGMIFSFLSFTIALQAVTVL